MVDHVFSTPDELSEYLVKQEKRIDELESNNQKLTDYIRSNYARKDELKTLVLDIVPFSNLFSKNYLTRAFAVWGHYFVAQLIIGLCVGAVYLVIIFVLLIFANI